MVPFFPPLPPSILTSYPPSVLGAWCVVRGAWCVVVHSPPPGSWLLNPGHRPPATDHQSCFALSGPRAWWGPLPRALPWADLFGPLRGGGTAKFQGSGFRVQGSGFRDQGSGIRDQGSGTTEHRARFTDSPIHRFTDSMGGGVGRRKIRPGGKEQEGTEETERGEGTRGIITDSPEVEIQRGEKIQRQKNVGKGTRNAEYRAHAKTPRRKGDRDPWLMVVIS